jgi:hypothetical protein
VCRAPVEAYGTFTILCRAPSHQTHDTGYGAPGAWTNLCRASSHVVHGKGSSPPCAWTNRCRAPRSTAHGKGKGQPCALTTLCRASCHVAHGKEHYPRTAVNTFSLSCVGYYARQPTVSCVVFSQSARQSSLPGKNESDALCRALWEKAHGKGGAVRFRPFAVRRRHTAKSAIPVVFLPTFTAPNI